MISAGAEASNAGPPSSESGDVAAPARVVIVGAGFAGLSAAKRLHGAPVDVTLIDRNNFHTFMPLLYQVATAGLEPEEIAQPVRRILRKAPNLRFRLGEVQGVDFEHRRVVLADGDEPYDYLLLAAGSAVNYFGVQSAAEYGIGLKDLADASELRNRVLLAFERAAVEPDPEKQQRLMTVVVAGGGPTGVELAGALAELTHDVLSHDYPELDVRHRARVILLEATGRLLSAFPPKLQRVAVDDLQRLGVEVRLNAPVTRLTADGVYLQDGELIASASVLWVAGVRASLLSDGLDVDLGPSRRIRVAKTLQLPARPAVLAAGDISCVDRGDQPADAMLAPVAMQQGKLAAENILRLARGRPAKAFHYRDLGVMATIGRRSAVAKIGPLQFHGFFAWILWLTLHLFWLIGLRNRLLVLTNWAWNYFFYESGARLITAERKPCGDEAREQR